MGASVNLLRLLCHTKDVTTESGTARSGSTAPTTQHTPEVVLCSVDDALTEAWHTVAESAGDRVRVHHGSVLDVHADAVVSPANSYGWMRGGIDSVYARAFPGVEQHVRNAILSYHGGELPVGQAVAAQTGEPMPKWLICAPTVREPGEQLPTDTVHPYLAARAVFEFWRTGDVELDVPAREAIDVIAMPGLGTGVGGVEPLNCARHVSAAWSDCFGQRST
ncbi:O-acetyl-ADP-ribose deacetylase (regulator of RNase III), contains Macro domain [Haloechinothrix alba]|uniref:O-acetyl-ADP-ribose deacetylase (Regulator of RNase III), contains Macro domain n=1 Tax=Haloechinothrix alba TaxID=664784 RepID=A0A238V5L0_9PSEU|nr:O-acetyl-ADP-ribose deacetylase (regulator of RNase III), contains Macro domain [Haloechinothrix alba]